MYLKVWNGSQHRNIYVDTPFCLIPSPNLLLKHIMKVDLFYFLSRQQVSLEQISLRKVQRLHQQPRDEHKDSAISSASFLSSVRSDQSL